LSVLTGWGRERDVASWQDEEQELTAATVVAGAFAHDAEARTMKETRAFFEVLYGERTVPDEEKAPGGCHVCHGEGVVTCPECDGEGDIMCDRGHDHECDECDGSGEVNCEACYVEQLHPADLHTIRALQAALDRRP
jgi:hypothetical protein